MDVAEPNESVDEILGRQSILEQIDGLQDTSHPLEFRPLSTMGY